MTRKKRASKVEKEKGKRNSLKKIIEKFVKRWYERDIPKKWDIKAQVLKVIEEYWEYCNWVITKNNNIVLDSLWDIVVAIINLLSIIKEQYWVNIKPNYNILLDWKKEIDKLIFIDKEILMWKNLWRLSEIILKCDLKEKKDEIKNIIEEIFFVLKYLADRYMEPFD